MKNDSATVHTPQGIRDELKVLLAEANSIISGSASDPVRELPAKLSTRIGAVRDRASDLYSRAKGRVVADAASANASIHAHPYKSLAIALGVGALAGAIAGVLFGRRSS